MSTSQSVFSGPARAPHRSLLRALGVGRGDAGKPLIGICNSYNELIPGHMHLNGIAQQVKFGVYEGGGLPLEFNVIGVCDGLAMNHEGMNYSLVSREVIADSVEIMAKAHALDAIVFVTNCDKIVPGMVMGAARLDIPAVMVTGGPMLGGDYQGSKVSLSNIFEGLGKYFKGQMSEADLADLEDAVCPTCGSCAGLFTANSMGCVMEALGLSLPGDATIPAPYSARLTLARQSGKAAVEVARKGWNIRRFITRPVSTTPWRWTRPWVAPPTPCCTSWRSPTRLRFHWSLRPSTRSPTPPPTWSSWRRLVPTLWKTFTERVA